MLSNTGRFEVSTVKVATLSVLRGAYNFTETRVFCEIKSNVDKEPAAVPILIFLVTAGFVVILPFSSKRLNWAPAPDSRYAFENS